MGTVAPTPHLLAWWALALVTAMWSLGLRWAAPAFGHDVFLDDMPIVTFVAVYVTLAAIVTVMMPRLIRHTSPRDTTRLLILIVAAGLIARLAQFGALPILEDDYHRYLWDGAVVMEGVSPFAYAPQSVADGSAAPELQALAARGADVLERLNYPEFRTVYPPALQAVFAAAHAIAPFDLDGWRWILLAFELASLGAILLILKRLGQSPLWAALYWWHPLVIKEVANSAHMEPVLMLPVLLALYAVLRGRSLIASALLAIAAGVKLWPLALLAPLWRQSLINPRALLAMVAVTGGILTVLIWPVAAAGLNDSSGFVAFAKNWKASSAVFLVADAITGWIAPATAFAPLAPRLLLVCIFLGVVLYLCRSEAPDGEATVLRMGLIAMALYILAPSQTPWYFVWMAPLLCILRLRGIMLAGVLMPLHYLYFHFAARDQADLYRFGIVWVIWLPVWALLITDWIANRSRVSAPTEVKDAA